MGHLLLILKICDRKGWKIEEDWLKLSDREKDYWIAYELARMEKLGDIQRHLADIKYALTAEAYAFLSYHILFG